MMAQAYDTRINNRPLLILARIAWLALAATGIVHVVLYLTALHENYRVPGWPLADLGTAADVLVWYSTGATSLSVLIFYAVSAFLIWGRGHERISILMAFFLVALGTSPVDTYTPVVLADVVTAYPILLRLSPLMGLVAWGGFSLFVMLFPDGRVVPRRGGWLIAYVLILVTVWNVIPPTSPFFFDNWPPLLFFATASTTLGCMLYVFIYRYRHVSTPSQRQQIKWVLYGIVVIIVFFICYFAQLLVQELSGSQETTLLIEITRGLAGLFLVFIPITIVIAILQYRLWDIDLIIRRTLTYATITLLLAITYFGGVILMQTIFSRLIGSESPLAVVASTLLIAALFNPLRTSVQAFVDRRFYRQKYDTQQTLERFGDIARDEVVLEEIEQALVATVNDTMQPEHVSLWLHETE